MTTMSYITGTVRTWESLKYNLNLKFIIMYLGEQELKCTYAENACNSSTVSLNKKSINKICKNG